MGPFALQRVQDQRQGRRQRFAFPSLHLGDATIKQTDAPEDLNVIMAHIKPPASGLANQRVGFGKQHPERLTTFRSVYQRQCLFAQLRIGQLTTAIFEHVHRPSFFHPFIDLVAAHAWNLPTSGDERAVGKLEGRFRRLRVHIRRCV